MNKMNGDLHLPSRSLPHYNYLCQAYDLYGSFNVEFLQLSANFVFLSGFKRKELVQGFQSIFQRAMEGTKLLWNGSRLVSRLHLENMILKILLIFLIHSLIKKNYSLELQLLATVILYLKTSCATPSPTSTYSRTSSIQYASTPSLLSFQSTITSDHGDYLPQTLNATASQGSNFSSHVYIDMSVKTETTLTHLQGNRSVILYCNLAAFLTENSDYFSL